MSNKVSRRRIDVTYDFLKLLVANVLLVSLFAIICLAGALDSNRTATSFNQKGSLRGQKITGSISQLGNEK